MIVQRLKRWMRLQAAEPMLPPGSEPPRRVLMVCMGNVCRSPTAEGVLRAKLQQAGLAGRVVVDSAGTHGYHTGEGPDPRATRHAALRGYEIAHLRARPVLEPDFVRHDWVLAMDEANLSWLLKRRPADALVQIELLMAYARRHTDVREVPDPYYGGPAGFDHALDLVEDACDGFVAHLAALPSAPADRT